MNYVVPISKRGTITIPNDLREKYDLSTPGSVSIQQTQAGLKIQPLPNFYEQFGAVEHKGKPLDFKELEKKFEKELAKKNV